MDCIVCTQEPQQEPGSCHNASSLIALVYDDGRAARKSWRRPKKVVFESDPAVLGRILADATDHTTWTVERLSN